MYPSRALVLPCILVGRCRPRRGSRLAQTILSSQSDEFPFIDLRGNIQAGRFLSVDAWAFLRYEWAWFAAGGTSLNTSLRLLDGALTVVTLPYLLDWRLPTYRDSD